MKRSNSHTKESFSKLAQNLGMNKKEPLNSNKKPAINNKNVNFIEINKNHLPKDNYYSPKNNPRIKRFISRW